LPLLNLKGIYVNAIAPGFIDTPGLKEPTGLDSQGMLEMIQAAYGNILVNRLGTPEEIAAVALFLASSESSFIVGQVISPNGGQVV